MGAIISFFNWVRDTFNAVLAWFWDLVQSFVKTLLAMLKDLFFWAVDTVLSLVTGIVDALSFDLSGLNVQQYLGALGAEAVNILGLIGMGSALGMIVGALVIRFTLQLIPFTRLGS